MKLNKNSIERRSFFQKVGAGVLKVTCLSLFSLPSFAKGWKELGVTSVPPAENVDNTLKRLFGNKQIEYNSTRLNYVTPNVAENGAVVPVKIDLNESIVGGNYVRKIYFIVDKNKRPQALTYEFTPETGFGHASGYLRMGETSWVQGILEFNDGSLLASKKQIKVVVGGCGG